MRRFSVLLKLSLIVLAGCSTERAAPPAPAPSPAPSPVPPVAPAVDTAAAAAQPQQQLPPVSETPRSSEDDAEGRDPFQPTVVRISPSDPSKDVRKRKSKRFTIDELKLVGIVSTSESPRAMLVDPRGKGWVVTRGELLGRAEVLHDGEGDHAVSWRVDRIRESEVVLVREDAAHSVVVPSGTRVLALHHAPVIADDAELDD